MIQFLHFIGPLIDEGWTFSFLPFMQIFLSFIRILSDAIDKSREIWSAAIELAHLMQTAAGFQGKLGEKGRGGGRGVRQPGAPRAERCRNVAGGRLLCKRVPRTAPIRSLASVWIDAKVDARPGEGSATGRLCAVIKS